MGSGTTLVACDRLERIGMGFEKDPTFYDMALRRLAMENANKIEQNLTMVGQERAAQIGLSL